MKFLNQKNFTLMELMVVIAVIAIMASFLIPSLGRARKASQTAICAGQMRQLSTADYMYTADNDDKFCYIRDDQGTRLWDMYLAQHYLGASITDTIRESGDYPKEATHPELYSFMEALLFCPNDTNWISSGGADVLRRTYSKSMRSSGALYADIHTLSLKPTQITNPSEFFQFIEQQYEYNMIGRKSHTGFLDSARWQLSAQAYPKLNFHKSNHYAFVNGSVRLIDVNQAAASNDWTPNKSVSRVRSTN